MPLTPYILEGKYFLQTALDLTSFHDWVVSGVMLLMLHGPLIAWMVVSVTRQVVQMGLCMGMSRNGCNRRVFSLGYHSAGRFHCSFREAVFPLGVFLFQNLGFFCYIFQNPCVCFSMPVLAIICA